MFCIPIQALAASKIDITEDTMPVMPTKSVSSDIMPIPLELDENQIPMERCNIELPNAKRAVLDELVQISDEMPSEETKQTDWHQDFVNMVSKFKDMGTYHFGSKADVTEYEQANQYVSGNISSQLPITKVTGL